MVVGPAQLFEKRDQALFCFDGKEQVARPRGAGRTEYGPCKAFEFRDHLFVRQRIVRRSSGRVIARFKALASDIFDANDGAMIMIKRRIRHDVYPRIGMGDRGISQMGGKALAMVRKNGRSAGGFQRSGARQANKSIGVLQELCDGLVGRGGS